MRAIFFLMMMVSGLPALTLGQTREVQVYLWPVEGLLGADSEVFSVPNLYLREGEVYHRIDAARGRPGRSLQTPNRETLEFYLQDVESGTYQLYASVAVPRSWPRAMILIFPERRLEGRQVEAMAVHFDPGRLRAGHATFTNYSPQTLRLVLNQDQVFSLATGETISLPRDQLEQRRVGDDSRFEVQLFLRDAHHQWRTGYQGVQYVRPDTINLFLISQGPSPHQVRMRVLRTSE